MQAFQRSALRSTQRFRPRCQRIPRRNASDSHGSHGHDSHAAPKNESFGRGFFIALAAIPATIAIVQFTREGENPYFTRIIRDTYNDYATKWANRNDLHTQMIEQAAADRVLFLNESARPLPTLRFPEQFNTGSPWNVPAGHGRVNIDQVIAKYEKESNEQQEKKRQQLKDGTLPVEQPVEPLIRRAPGPSN